MSGFDEADIKEGLANLLAEFRERPWIIRPAAFWDAERGRLVVITHHQGNDPDAGSGAALDEIRDCVIACVGFSSQGIHFDVEESIVVREPEANPNQALQPTSRRRRPAKSKPPARTERG